MKNRIGLVLAAILVFTGCASSSVEKAKKVKRVKLNFEAPIRSSFSKIELDEDLETVKYLICSAYAGYDKALENGFDIDASIEEIRTETLKNLNNMGMVDTSFYQQKIFDVLFRDMKLNDMHFSVNGFGHSIAPINKLLLFTDVYLEKTGDDFYVYHTEDDKIPVGEKYTGSIKNLYETYLGEKLLYRYAVMANPNTKRLTLSLESGQIPVQTVKKEEFKYKNYNASVIETEACVYVGLQSFGMNGVNEYYMFNEMCKKIKTDNPDKTLILDLRDNGGGDGLLAAQLVASIYFPFDSENHMAFYDFLCRESLKHKVQADSDAVDQMKKFYKKSWEAAEENDKNNPYNRDVEMTEEDTDILKIYDLEAEQHKKVYVLIDSGSASASEYTTGMLSLIKNADVTLVGGRSWGAVEYVGMRGFPLPKSGIGIRIGNYYGAPPCISQNEKFHGEGEGFYPEWWVDNKNMLNTLIQLTGDSSLEEKLSGLEKWQL